MTTPRIALITGATKGIGFETARQLAGQGITVLMGARDAARGQAVAATLAAEGLPVSVLALDVTAAASIAAAVATVESLHGRLDILVNNAGILDYGADTGPSTTTIDTFRRIFDTNFFGLVAVTQAFLPLLRRSPAGRIVNLSSILGSHGEHADPNSTIHQVRLPAYDCSKSAVNLFTIELALELKDTAIKVNAAHPGWVKTDMGGPDAQLEVAAGASTSVTLATLGANGPSGAYHHQGNHLRW